MATNNQLLDISNQLSLTCFLNSLLKEYAQFAISEDRKKVIFPISNDANLEAEIQKYSELGCHNYTGRNYLEKNGIKTLLSFELFILQISDHLAVQMQSSEADKKMFVKRVFDSRNNILESLQFRLNHNNLFDPLSFDFVQAEQGLLIGHNFHPTPKIRDEFDLQDMQKYSPEFASKFPLKWILCHPNRVHHSLAKSFTNLKWTTELLQDEGLAQNQVVVKYLEQGFIPYPMHPWQYEVLKKDVDVASYFFMGEFIDLPVSPNKLWKPTSSLRSIYREDAPYMLKFSMTLKLTNSIRHLLAHEVGRGLQLRDVLNSTLGLEFQKKNPQFKVLTEPAFLAFKNKKGEIIEGSILLCRENLFEKENSSTKAVLATLTQKPIFGTGYIQRALEQSNDHLTADEKCMKWFDGYLHAVVRPLIDAQANYGIMMGAHQQNLILELKNGYPVKSYFRDCQGTGYSELGLTNFSALVDSVNPDCGNIVTSEMGNILFGYYLILNSTFNVISSLAEPDGNLEKKLIKKLFEFLMQSKMSNPKDTFFLDYLLTSPYLMHKGNFICSIKSINENTTENPFAIYCKIKNPLVEFVED